MIGKPYSTSNNACIIRFKRGPLDGQSGLFDSDGSHCRANDQYIIQTIRDGVQYDYERIAPKCFGLSRVWIDGKAYEQKEMK